MSRKGPRKGSCRSRCREMHQPKSVAKWVSALIGLLENASKCSVDSHMRVPFVGTQRTVPKIAPRALDYQWIAVTMILLS